MGQTNKDLPIFYKYTLFYYPCFLCIAGNYGIPCGADYQTIDLKKHLRWNIKQLWIPEGLQIWSTDQCALQCILEYLTKNTDVRWLLLSLMKIRGWGLFHLLLRRAPHFQREKTTKKKKKTVGRFFVAVELGARGSPLSRSNQGPRHTTTDIHHMEGESNMFHHTTTSSTTGSTCSVFQQSIL